MRADIALRSERVWRVVLLLLFLALGIQAEDAPVLEYQVKGAFLVKFGAFVEWPVGATDLTQNGEFNIGILGSDPFGKNLDDAVRTETVKGKNVRVLRGRELSELADCQIIFIPRSETGRLQEILKALSGRPVLTVGEDPGFAVAGGMINFFKENGKVRFEINPRAAEEAGLKLSAKLLQVGKLVAPAGKGAA